MRYHTIGGAVPTPPPRSNFERFIIEQMYPRLLNYISISRLKVFAKVNKLRGGGEGV